MHTNQIENHIPQRMDRRQFLGVAIAGGIACTACAGSGTFVTERDETPGWTTHTRTIFGKTVTFSLPPGGVLNPAPGADPFKFGDGSFGGVTYGQRPQGRELAALMVSVALRRYPSEVSPNAWGITQLGDWIDRNTSLMRRIESKSITNRKLDWHQQVVYDGKTGNVDEIRYVAPFDSTRYLTVFAALWPTYAKSPENVESAKYFVERMMQSIEIK